MNNGKYTELITHPNFIKNYINSGVRQKNKSIALQNDYNTNPRVCKHCNKIIIYSKRTNIFCSKSCSATYNNVHKHYKITSVSRKKLSLAASKNNLNRTIQKEFNYINSPNKCVICNTTLAFKNKNKKTCSKNCLTILFHDNAKNNNLGGNHNRRADWFISKIAGKVWLESSYERIVATELDNNNIQWNRPKGIKWVDSTDKLRTYLPDFYLIDYDVYLDPKNDYLIKKDYNKIQTVIKQNNIKLYVLNSSNLSWDKIKTIMLEARK